MAFQNRNDLGTGAKIEEWVQTMVPEVVLAVESLELATPERVHTCLEQHNIKATRSETEMALEYGCRIGVMEEKRRYRLNPELRTALKSSCGCSKRNPNNATNSAKSRMGRYCENDDCNQCSSMDCESELSSKRPKSEDYYGEDYDDVDFDSNFENDDDL